METTANSRSVEAPPCKGAQPARRSIFNWFSDLFRRRRASPAAALKHWTLSDEERSIARRVLDPNSSAGKPARRARDLDELDPQLILSNIKSKYAGGIL